MKNIPGSVFLKTAIIAVVAMFSLAGGVVRAQEFLKHYAVPLPDMKLMPEAEFSDKTILYEETPGGDPALSLKMRLPKDWKKPEDLAVTSYQMSDKILGELVRFYGPPVLDTRSIFSIQAINLEYKLTATQWLLQYLLSNGYTIQGMKEHSEKRAEALYVKIENDVTYAIRVIAQINGKRIIMAQYIMPADSWDDEKQMQAQVMNSFVLTHPVEEVVEEMDKYHFLDIAEFTYPKSWQFKADKLKSAERMSFNLLNVLSEKDVYKKKYKTLDGRIQVDIVYYDLISSTEKEIENLKDSLTKISLVGGALIEKRKDFKFATGVDRQDVEVYQAVDSQNNLLEYEYWVVPIEYNDYYYFISLVTPSRDEDFFVWARNTETFKQVVEMFTPLEDSLISR